MISDYKKRRTEYCKRTIAQCKKYLKHYPDIIRILNGRYIYNELKTDICDCGFCPEHLFVTYRNGGKSVPFCHALYKELIYKEDDTRTYRDEECIKKSKKITDEDRKILNELKKYDTFYSWINRIDDCIAYTKENLDACEKELERLNNME